MMNCRSHPCSMWSADFCSIRSHCNSAGVVEGQMLHCFTQTAMVLGHCKTRWTRPGLKMLKMCTWNFALNSFFYIKLPKSLAVWICSSLFNADEKNCTAFGVPRWQQFFKPRCQVGACGRGEVEQGGTIDIKRLWNPEEFEEYSTVEENIHISYICIYIYSHIVT